MTPEQQLIIMKFQFAAALLMGVDYFLPDHCRKKADANVSNYSMRVKKRVESDVKKEFGDFKSNRILIETAKAAIGIGLQGGRLRQPGLFA